MRRRRCDSVHRGVPELNSMTVRFLDRRRKSSCQRQSPFQVWSGGGPFPRSRKTKLLNSSALSVSPRPTGLVDDFSLVNFFLVPTKREGFAATFICRLDAALKLNFTDTCAAVAPDTFGRFDQVQNILLPDTMVSEGGNDAPAENGK